MLSLDDLRLIETLGAVHSLAGAARELAVTAPAVSQRLQQIERKLGLRLVDRSNRGLLLTDDGDLMVARARAILADVSDLNAEMAARRGEISGPLRVMAPFGFGRRYVAPVAARFCELYPSVRLSLTLSETPRRLGDQPWDICVHIGEMPDSAWIVQKIAPNARIVCAAPLYLERRGRPTQPGQLTEHVAIALEQNDSDVTLWRFTSLSDRRSVNVRMKASMSTNDGDIARSWAIAGHGLLERSEWDVANDLAAGRLVAILPSWRTPEADVTVFLAPRHARAERTTRFVEMLRKSLTPAPWRQHRARR
jgi:DNA-binding transcriptional LysR family regulator